ncbi:MAG: methyltransferase domain-containing protein [Halioglobus sp.]
MLIEPPDIPEQLEKWYSGANGEYLLDHLQRTLDCTLDTAFGYHLLQLGVTRGQPLFTNSPVNHRIYAAEQAGGAIGLVSHSDEIPLESDSIDILIAHHSLEFTSNPHQVLREMQRVLAPQGHLLMIGFNPYSLFGLSSFLRGKVQHPLWQHHAPVSPTRVKDWLHLLGCEVQQCSYLYPFPPLGQGRLRQWTERSDQWLSGHNIHTGGLYLTHAIKQVVQRTKPRKRMLLPRERLMGLTVPKPAASPSPIVPTRMNGDIAA